MPHAITEELNDLIDVMGGYGGKKFLNIIVEARQQQ